MATERYNAVEREKHWQKIWAERDVFRAGDDYDQAEVLCA